MSHDDRVLAMAVLREERDLIWVVIDNVRLEGRDRIFDVHFLARDEPTEPPQTFLSGYGYREPIEAIASWLNNLAGAVLGEHRALRHDPVSDGLSMELKAQGEGGDLRFEVVLWLDLTRVGPAMKARANRGRHQSGLRFFVTRQDLDGFREMLVNLVYPDEEPPLA